MNKNKMTALLLAACALTAAGCGNRAKEALEALEKDRFLVRTETVQVRPLEDYILLTGSVRALDEATLYPRAAGKLLRNLLKEGDPVRKDEAVALVERDEVGVVYEPAPVPSTLSGIVGRVYQDTGATVTPQTPIALVVDQSKVRVEVDVPEKYIGKVFRDQTAKIKVDAFPDRYFTGKVYRVSPVLDARSRSTVVEVLLDNAEGRLKSGMFAEVRVIVASRGAAVTVPSGAVMRGDGEVWIFVPAGDTARRVPVKTGIATAEFTQVDGVKAGDEVITFGLYGLKDGSKIKAQ
ncbi:MAG: RND family efflux transporter MFP subunit [Elusimicrobia bacterium]|nr:MAG: RND family efflux transporter MFP subunit [Elusimicrobiota bacterium]KAF0157849.1 MAG: RND family efflux transporter MFP subunit [Elusimicrobiota bacterium]